MPWQQVNPWSEPWAGIRDKPQPNLNPLWDSFASPNSGQSLTFLDQWRVLRLQLHWNVRAVTDNREGLLFDQEVVARPDIYNNFGQ